MPFVGIISKENDSNFIKNAISKNSKESNFEIININRNSIENVKNVKCDILVICEHIEKMTKNSSYLEEIIKKADYIIVNSDIKENLSILRNVEANIITYGFNAKATITISSIKEEKIIVSIQRELISANNKKIEIQEKEIDISQKKDKKVYTNLVVFIIKQLHNL